MRVLVLLVVGLMAGCSGGRGVITDTNEFKTIRLDGVTYYLWREMAMYSGYGYMSVKLGKDSKVVECE